MCLCVFVCADEGVRVCGSKRGRRKGGVKMKREGEKGEETGEGGREEVRKCLGKLYNGQEEEKCSRGMKDARNRPATGAKYPNGETERQTCKI